jgi:succinate-acetate transporter protein
MTAAARVMLRPIGNPLPLGFLALAGGTLVVSALQLGWVPPAEGTDVALVLLGFVFPLQLLASVFGYLARDVIAGTAMGVLSGAWLCVGLITLTSPPGATSDALGLLLLVAGVGLLVDAAAAATGGRIAAVVLATAGIRFACTGIYELTDSAAWEDIAGVVGVVLLAVGLVIAAVIVFGEIDHTDQPGVREHL